MTVLDIRDVSHHDYDAKRTDTSATPMLIAKWTQGSTFEDPSHAYWVGKGLPTAAYHCVEPDRIADLDAQISFMLAKIGTSRPVMLDWEVWNDSRGERWASVPEALHIAQGFKAKGGNLKALYLPHWFWLNNLKGASLSAFADLGLFNINSNYAVSPLAASAMATFGGLPVKMHQYTSTPYDKNAYASTVAELLQLWGFTEGDDMTPAEFKTLLQDPDVKAYFQAVAWQYDGRGFSVPGDASPTTLDAINAAAHSASADDVTALEAKVDALSAKVDALATGGVDEAALATAVVDLEAQRLQS